jgi:hypothetical protein
LSLSRQQLTTAVWHGPEIQINQHARASLAGTKVDGKMGDPFFHTKKALHPWLKDERLHFRGSTFVGVIPTRNG